MLQIDQQTVCEEMRSSVSTIQYRRQREKLSFTQRYDRLIKNCSNYLGKKLNVANCIDLILFAKKHQMNRLILLCAVFIDANFEKVFTSDEFIEMEIDGIFDLTTVLIFNEMTKNDLKNAIMFWCQYKRRERNKHIDDLLA